MSGVSRQVDVLSRNNYRGANRKSLSDDQVRGGCAKRHLPCLTLPCPA